MALSADDKLILVRVRIERAKKHISDLNTTVMPYIGKRKSELIKRANRQPGESFLEHRELPVIPFDALAAAGDTIQNLRSALDHLAFSFSP